MATAAHAAFGPPLFLPHAAVQALLDRIAVCGYHCIGPQLREQSIVYDSLQRAEQLPWGISEAPGTSGYPLQHGAHAQAFAWSNASQAIKPQLFPPREALWRVTRDLRGKLAFEPVHPQSPRLALFGVRPCDLRALDLQDRLFVSGRQPDPRYAARRLHALLLVVNCTHSASCCFCTSTGGGPRAASGFDLALTELDDGFVVELAQRRAADLVAPLQLPAASPAQLATARQRTDRASAQQTRTLPPPPMLHERLMQRLDHPRWDVIAERCLSCGHCARVCPSCFCHSECDETSADGKSCIRYRLWDSCFSCDHSYVAGQVLRDTVAKRYRQWLTHKLATWQDQFGSSGCVGCGRCIKACPAGIDITTEATVLCQP